MRKKESKRPLGTAPGLCAVYRHAAMPALAAEQEMDLTEPSGVSSEVSEEPGDHGAAPMKRRTASMTNGYRMRRRTWATEKSVRLQMEDCT